MDRSSEKCEWAMSLLFCRKFTETVANSCQELDSPSTNSCQELMSLGSILQLGGISHESRNCQLRQEVIFMMVLDKTSIFSISLEIKVTSAKGNGEEALSFRNTPCRCWETEDRMRLVIVKSVKVYNAGGRKKEIV